LILDSKITRMSIKSKTAKEPTTTPFKSQKEFVQWLDKEILKVQNKLT